MDLIKVENLNNLSKYDNLQENDLYKFIKETFEDGAVPENKEEFLKCFDNETSDNSLCFHNFFGENKEKEAQLHLYPHMCIIPLPTRYRESLRDKSGYAVVFVDLRWKALVVEQTKDVKLLRELLDVVEVRRFTSTNSVDDEIDSLVANSYKVLWGEISQEDYKAKITNLEIIKERINEQCASLRKTILEKVQKLETKKQTSSDSDDELV